MIRFSIANIHTYIIGHFNPSIRIIDLASQTTYVACVNFLHKLREIQFKVDSKRQILRDFSWQFYLLSEFLPQICRKEIAEKILFVFCFDVWPGARTLALHLISQHITYYTRLTPPHKSSIN